MPTNRMQKVPTSDLAGRPVFNCQVAPCVKGQGDTDYLCAGCDTTVLSKVRFQQVQNIVFKCPHCGTHSTIGHANEMN